MGGCGGVMARGCPESDPSHPLQTHDDQVRTEQHSRAVWSARQSADGLRQPDMSHGPVATSCWQPRFTDFNCRLSQQF